MKNIVFLDIDGTILDVPRGLKEPTNKTKYAISELINNGNLVFVASGRHKGNLSKSIIDLKPSGYILTNGSYIEYQGKVLHQDAFDIKMLNSIEEFCIKHNCLFIAESQEFVYTPNYETIFKNHPKSYKVHSKNFVSSKEGVIFNKCNLYFNDYESAKLFEKEFKGKVDYRVQTVDLEKLSYDVNTIGINKGKSAEIILNKLGINKENTYCFCDGLNDLELVQVVKYSYAMDNGDKKLKRITTGVTDDVLNDGLYNKLVELKLIKEKHD